MKFVFLFFSAKFQASSIELSMGMSTDYMQAIKQGADVVRVGSKIFGAREVKK